MNWNTARNIADTYDQAMIALDTSDKPEASVKQGQYPGSFYVETVDGDFHRVGEWNSFADKTIPEHGAFYHVS